MTPRIDLAVERTGVLTPARVRALARRVRKAARAMGCIPEEIDGIELRIVDDPRMQELKAAHLGVAEATDVLAFPAGDALPCEEAPGLGEVVLNRDAVARRQQVQPQRFDERALANPRHAADAHPRRRPGVRQQKLQQTLSLLLMIAPSALHQGDGLGQGAAVSGHYAASASVEIAHPPITSSTLAAARTISVPGPKMAETPAFSRPA